jgi:hypothetical protein
MKEVTRTKYGNGPFNALQEIGKPVEKMMVINIKQDCG